MNNKTQSFRLPTSQELLTLVNSEKQEPACDLSDTECANYWSANLHPHDSKFAYGVSFDFGYLSYSEYKSFVRCVRDTSNGLEWSKSSKSPMTWNEAVEYAKTLTDDDVYK